jgi:hypothetical protein
MSVRAGGDMVERYIRGTIDNAERTIGGALPCMWFGEVEGSYVSLIGDRSAGERSPTGKSRKCRNRTNARNTWHVVTLAWPACIRQRCSSA